MCATYFVDDGTAMEMLEVINELNRKFGYETVSYDQIYPQAFSKTGDIYPKQTALAGSVRDARFTVSAPIWGFPMKQSGKVSFNARAENLKKYGMWKRAYTSGRAFVPARGFYENRKSSNGKSERYSFTDPHGGLLLLAAMIEKTISSDGNSFEAFTIITVDANLSVKDIHDRMPFLLDQEELALWMTDEGYADSILTRTGPRLVSVLSPKPESGKENEQFSLFD